MRGLAWGLGWSLGVLLGWACGGEPCAVGSDGCACTGGGACDPGLACIADTCTQVGCPVGSMGCPCTGGGACDPGLRCDGGRCMDAGGTGAPPSAQTTADPSAGPGGDPVDGSTTTGTDPDSGSDTDDDIKLDVGNEGTTGGVCTQTGCTQVDMLFALDSSLSMQEEISALAASEAFTAIVQGLEDLNCGDIEYRIGLTNDNDGGFIGTGANDNPWFDSNEMSPDQIAAAFTSAANTVLGNGGTGIGCEHVLSSSLATLGLDTSGFLRPEALLVLVLITDVDDYGDYDQMGFGGPCDGFLCTETPQPVADIYASLLTLKGGEPEALAAIVVAGDPGVTAGLNTCQQPASCCGGGFECAQAHHAPRLWQFADLQAGTNGFTGDICEGAAQVPVLIQQALSENIDLACQTYEPAG